MEKTLIKGILLAYSTQVNFHKLLSLIYIGFLGRNFQMLDGSGKISSIRAYW